MLRIKKYSFKGQVLLFSLLLLSSAVLISFSLSTIYIRDIRLSNDSVASLKAFYLADWASEGNLYTYLQNNCVPPYSALNESQQAQDSQGVYIGTYETEQCDDTGIVTVGQSGSTSRSIEVNFQ